VGEQSLVVEPVEVEGVAGSDLRAGAAAVERGAAVSGRNPEGQPGRLVGKEGEALAVRRPRQVERTDRRAAEDHDGSTGSVPPWAAFTAS
jgi:hypothetical protein